MRLTAAINVIQHNMDFYVLLHVCWAICLLWRQRSEAGAEVWPRYCCFLATVTAFQYLLCLGPSPALCKGLRSATSRFGKLKMKKRPKKEQGKARQWRAGGLLPCQRCKRRAPTRQSKSRRRDHSQQQPSLSFVLPQDACSGAEVGW